VVVNEHLPAQPHCLNSSSSHI